ncbi:DNA/RNA non-specific endonuclease [[Flexibacter] sp. ATCC 35208]|uniref:DNA/RNA non-specific endonuclease n=1 Tax=[Flexibacter] sp. ATCC 35208 TaxID=1936242 RepID=UPI0009D0092B|nr:DNA/RNA non-specific endonuclease [[Flexibacter] sp. ATCC 35208]OMP79000.1 DNA/RNA endonuclease [[Flexibacter] sp. ATCC 35208]
MQAKKLLLPAAFVLLILAACEKQGDVAVKPAASTPDTIRYSGGGSSSADTCGTYTANTSDNSHILLGNPSSAQPCIEFPANYLIDRDYWIGSYNSLRGGPNWVSWHLQASDVGSSGRTDDFRADTELPSTFYQVQSTSFTSSGFDRGHNCPSGDRTSSVDANEATFLMSNMIPQAPNNNQKAWATFEDYTRNTLAGSANECFIIMGSYGTGGTGSAGAATTIDGGNVTVPRKVWKVVVVIPIGDNDLSRITSSATVVAIDTPNDNTTVSTNWKEYITTVKAIEDSTGYSLLSNLPTDVQTALKSKVYVP